MKLPDELEQIEQWLNRGEITGARAAELIEAFRSARGAPWKWKEWKQERPLLIRDRCTQCGDTDGPFILQHLQGIPRIGHLVDDLYRQHPEFDDGRASLYEKYEDIKANEVPGERPCCPSCEGPTINRRKRTRDWRCGKCGHTFLEPGVTHALTQEQRRRIADQKEEAYEESQQKSRAAAWATVGREGVLYWLGVYREYLAFTYAVTFCKKCAYLWDKHQMRKCHACGKTYPAHRAACHYCGIESPSIDAMLAVDSGQLDPNQKV